MGFEKGKPVFILDDPQGTPWVMQAYSQIVEPNLTYADLQKLDGKMKVVLDGLRNIHNLVPRSK